MKLFGSISELVSAIFRKDSQLITLRPNQTTTYTAARDVQLPPQDAASVLVSADATQILTNKTIDGDDNTVQDLSLSSIKTALADANKPLVRDGSGVVASSFLVNANIDAAAAIDATKIADGSVTNAEFQALNGLSGAITTASNTQTLSNKTIDGDDNTLQDIGIASLKTVLADADKVIRRDAAGAVISGNSLPNSSALVTTDSTSTLSNKTLAFPVVTTAAIINAQGELRLADSDSSNYVSFKAPAVVSSNVNYILPAADGTSSQVLSTNGSGTLSWVTGGTGTPGQLPGTSTDDNASAGNVGEYIESVVSGSFSGAVNTPITITSITLSAGDWDVQASLFVNEGTSGGTQIEVSATVTQSGGAATNGVNRIAVRGYSPALLNYGAIVTPLLRATSDGTNLDITGSTTQATQIIILESKVPDYSPTTSATYSAYLRARRVR